MRQATEKDREKILKYLGQNVKDCIYLYIDIMNYGVCSENMKVWVNEEDELSLVVMKYYDSFQVYSHKVPCDTAPVVELLQQYPVAMVSGRRDIIELLEKECPDYKVTYGAVFVMDHYRELSANTEVVLATEADTEEIARLICSNEEIGAHYTVENLTAQLSERIRTGTGRSYIIREEGEIVAHSATYAEADDVAVVSGTIIKPEFRARNYYVIISNYMMQQLRKENKKVYTFAISDKMIHYHDLIHKKCGEYGKLVNKPILIK